MTVFYIDEISNGESFQVCFKILRRWKGSLYKLVWFDLLIYLVVYYALNFSYRFAMTENQRRVFENLVQLCDTAQRGIPISFLLGFYVSGIVSRWFLAFACIPWLNRPAFVVAAYVDAKNEETARKIRLTLMRYLNLSWILMMRLISDQTAHRFPDHEEESARTTATASRKPLWRRAHKPKLCRCTCKPWDIGRTQPSTPRFHATAPNQRPVIVSTPMPNAVKRGGPDKITDCFQAIDDFQLIKTLQAFNDDKQVKRTFGLLISEDETAAFQTISRNWYRRCKTKYIPEYWIPIEWAQRLTLLALRSGYIPEQRAAHEILEELMRFRSRLQNLQLFSNLIIPLAYSQVVTIAVYTYFLCQIFARQFVQRPEDMHGFGDLYVPVISIFSFLFLIGWYKVALCVVNPFGDDDEDFQVNNILDYNLEVSYRTAYMHNHSFPHLLTLPLPPHTNSEPETESLEQFFKEIDLEKYEKLPSESHFGDSPDPNVSQKCCTCLRRKFDCAPLQERCRLL